MTTGEWKSFLIEWLTSGEFNNLLPEVRVLKGVPQAPEFHPEGDAWVHTMQSVEALEDDADERVFWAVLLHDIGKSTTTEYKCGKWRSHRHAIVGSEMVHSILKRFGLIRIADDVAWLVKHHQYELSWNLKSGQILTKRQKKFTEHFLFPLLLKVCAADVAGRVPNKKWFNL